MNNNNNNNHNDDYNNNNTHNRSNDYFLQFLYAWGRQVDWSKIPLQQAASPWVVTVTTGQLASQQQKKHLEPRFFSVESCREMAPFRGHILILMGHSVIAYDSSSIHLSDELDEATFCRTPRTFMEETVGFPVSSRSQHQNHPFFPWSTTKVASKSILGRKNLPNQEVSNRVTFIDSINLVDTITFRSILLCLL